MRRLISVLFMTLAGCGVAYQQTPEPNETERVNGIVAALGTEQTYNSETLLWNARPDGLVLRSWMERRKATLDGTLRPDKLPALSNPGSISDTLEWERATSRREGNSHRPWDAYRVSLEADVWRCPATGVSEAAWYDRYAAEHAKGQHDSLIDWEAQLVKFRGKCESETAVRSAQLLAEHQHQEAEEQQQKDDEASREAARQECRRQWDEAFSHYAENPTIERWRGLEGARAKNSKCLDAARGEI